MSASFDFHGKKALVTGASQGIGYGLALALAHAGATVVALDRNGSKLEDLRKKHDNVTIVVADVTLSEWALASILAPHQPFHFLLNNAGISILESCLTIKEESLARHIDVNLKAPILLAKIVANEMIRRSIRGVIVNVSSQASKRPLKDHLAYCVTKAGLDMASRCFAKELGEHGIRVNNVNPTVVMTEMGKMVICVNFELTPS
ncbi:oxidoreductase, short chain dehydrogenase/reductase family protein [Ostertagia ostertagi]